MNDIRFDTLHHWLQTTLKKQDWTITPLAGDASFRRYFRVQLPDRSLVAMDAPPEKENIKPFIAIALAFTKLGIHVPEIIAMNLEQGFLLLSDLGDNLYSTLLNNDNAEQLYGDALDTLQRIQTCQEIIDNPLPDFDQVLILREWNLFVEWALKKHWQTDLNTHNQHMLSNTLEFLTQEFLAQPKICVHRDYHSRNLLWLDNHTVGVLDFQDAVWGPITYDALSLLRDCYIAWPRVQVEKWALLSYQRAREDNLLPHISGEQFIRWFDLLGIQRHLKCLGIFARLNHLYNKPNYLKDMPRTLNYILQVSEHYPELKEFRAFLQMYSEPL